MEIKRLMDYELELVFNQDTTAMEQFYPDDMVATNPFNQFIDKPKLMELGSAWKKVVYHANNVVDQ